MTEHVTLHVIRKDVLLWALGGVAAKVPQNRYSADVIRRIRELAKYPRLPYGLAAREAEVIGVTENTLHVLVSCARHGREPRFWSLIA